MAQPTVKYLAIMRLIDGQLLAAEAVESQNYSSFTAEFKTLVKRLEEVDLQPNERQKVRSQNGAWFVTCDMRRIHYAVLADSAYPERHAYGLISDVIEQLQTLPDYHMETDSVVKNHTKRYLPKLLERYSDLRKIDKLYQANEKVAQIQSTMADNINKVMVNSDSLDRLDVKTQDFKNLAEGFYHDSDALAKAAKRNKRCMIILAVVIALVIIAVIAIYVIKT